MDVLANLRPKAKMFAATAVKTAAYRTGLHRAIFARYDYMFRPVELAFLTECLTKTHERGLTGPILEIGCAAGATTVYLDKHLSYMGDDREYVCIDTFAGFTQEDIDVEIERGHDASQYNYVFKAYRKPWFDQTMENNGVTRVRSIQADANTFDFSQFDKISFCLIDVDLKRPVERSLAGIVDRMAPGGIIVIDDCKPNNLFDGALAGYTESVERIGYPVDVRFDMLGVIEVPEA